MKKILQLIIILFLVTNINGYAQPSADTIAYWGFDQPGASVISEQETGVDLQLRSHNGRHEWIESGVKNQAIRLNGYSTWADGNIALNLPSDEFSLVFWTALESYPVSNAAFFARYDQADPSGMFIGINKFGRLISEVNVGSIFTQSTSSSPLEKFAWNHVVFTFNSTANTFEVYQNGIKVINKNLPNGNIKWPQGDTTFIGRNAKDEKNGIFPIDVINGIVDEMVIYDKALTSSEISSLYQNEKPNTDPDLSIPDIRFQGDLNRPVFHAQPPAAWTNEPHGLVYHNGLYHIFYQKNANGPFWSQITWGHQTSPDLVRWTEERPVLWPEPGNDQFGIWSGDCIIDDNGNPLIFYTGVDGTKAGMNIATGNADLSTWQKFNGNPVIPSPPPNLVTMDFRDPFLWKENGNWYMIIGSGLVSSASGGAVFLYKSSDLTNWTYLRPLMIGQPANDGAGPFWEMPMLLNLGGKHVLVVNKVPEPGSPAIALYWTGTFVNEKFSPDFAVPKKVELINGLLAPTAEVDSLGRLVSIGIIPDGWPSPEHYTQGWAHLYSLPRIWDLDENDNLIQKPLPELSILRGKHHQFSDLTIADGQTDLLPGINSRHVEIKARIDPGTANEFGIILGKASDGSEQTVFSYNTFFEFFSLDRGQSSTNPNAPDDLLQTSYSLPKNQPVDLHIFFDGSVIEVFINEKEAFATRVFPVGTQSDGIDLFAKGGSATALKIDIWEMRDMNDPTVGIGDFLFDGMNKNSFIEKAIPNPFSESVSVEYVLDHPGAVNYQIFDLSGRLIWKGESKFQNSGKNEITWDGKNSHGEAVPTDLYIFQLQKSTGETDFIKILKR